MDTTPDLMPMDTSRDLFHFTDGALAYAGYHVHPDANALHTHSFVEIAFAVGGEGIHNSLTGRRQLRRGDVVFCVLGCGTDTTNAGTWNCITAVSAASCCATSWPGPARIRCSATCCGPVRTRCSAAAC